MLSVLIAFAASAGTATTAPAPQDDPIICTKVNVGDEVGTRLRTKKKVCMHKSDRDFIAKQEKDAIRQLINNGDARMATPSEQPR